MFNVVKFIVAEFPLQNTTGAGWLTWADGLTVTINVLAGPVQVTPALVKDGVTTMVELIGIVPPLTAVNDGMKLPVSPTKPILELELVQEYDIDPPVFEEVRLILAAVALQNTCVTGWSTWAEGFTVIVNVIGAPAQLNPALLNVGVTNIVPVTWAVPLFEAINGGRFAPEPLIKPILWAVFDQE